MHAKECDLCRGSIPDVSCSRNACTVYIMSSKFEPHDRPIYTVSGLHTMMRKSWTHDFFASLRFKSITACMLKCNLIKTTLQ